MHSVYKYVYNHKIIYVGKCDSVLSRRLSQHGRKGDNIPEIGFDEINKADIFYTLLPNRTMTDVFESELIRRYKPKYNKSKTSEWSGLPFVEPKWIPYKVGGEIIEQSKRECIEKEVTEKDFLADVNNQRRKALERQKIIFRSMYGVEEDSEEGQQILGELQEEYEKSLNEGKKILERWCKEFDEKYGIK